MCRHRSLQGVISNRWKLREKCLIQVEFPPKGVGGLACLSGVFQKSAAILQGARETNAVLRHIGILVDQSLGQRLLAIDKRLRLGMPTDRVKRKCQFMKHHDQVFPVLGHFRMRLAESIPNLDRLLARVDSRVGEVVGTGGASRGGLPVRQAGVRGRQVVLKRVHRGMLSGKGLPQAHKLHQRPLGLCRVLGHVSARLRGSIGPPKPGDTALFVFGVRIFGVQPFNQFQAGRQGVNGVVVAVDFVMNFGQSEIRRRQISQQRGIIAALAQKCLVVTDGILEQLLTQRLECRHVEQLALADTREVLVDRLTGALQILFRLLPLLLGDLPLGHFGLARTLRIRACVCFRQQARLSEALGMGRPNRLRDADHGPHQDRRQHHDRRRERHAVPAGELAKPVR